jgi:hypothetical protein
MDGGSRKPAVLDQLGLAALDLTPVVSDTAEHGVEVPGVDGQLDVQDDRAADDPARAGG